MTSEKLQKAREFEAQYGPHIPDTERPAFHATPTIGWMNDPNGFSFYKGECHLFYQYHPYSNEWGPMHWGHLKTKDFIRWERLLCALAPDGRRIMVAWMQNWDTVGGKPFHCRWFGQMTLPRELSVENGRLYQRPVRELDRYRRNPVAHHHILVSGETNLPGVQGRLVDMTVTVKPMGQGSCRWFRLHVAKDGQHDTIIRYKPGESTVKLDRCRSGLPRDIVHTRSFLVRPHGGELKLRVVLDRFSVEVFVNDGEAAASAVIYTRQEADAITFEADGQVLIDVEKYDLVFDGED